MFNNQCEETFSMSCCFWIVFWLNVCRCFLFLFTCCHALVWKRSNVTAKQPSEFNCHHAFLFPMLPCIMCTCALESVQTKHKRGEWSLPGMDHESSGDKVKQKPGRPRKKYLETGLDTHKDYVSYRKAMQKIYERNWTLVDHKKCNLFLILWASLYGSGGRTTNCDCDDTTSATN